MFMGNFFKNIANGFTNLVQNAGSSLIQAFGGGEKAQAAASAAGALFGGMQNANNQQDLINQQFRHQEYLMNQQNAFNEQMFDKQLQANKNSIIDQYNQFRELGINPSSMNLTQSPMASLAASGSAPNVPLVSSLEVAQADLARAEAGKLNAETNLLKKEEGLTEAQTKKTLSERDTVEGLRDAQIKTQWGEYRFKNAQTLLTNKQARLMTREINSYDDKLANMNADTQLKQAQTYSINSRAISEWVHDRAEEQHWSRQDEMKMREISLKAAEVSQFIQESQARINQIQADIQLKGAEADEVQAQKALLQKEAERLGIDINFENDTYTWKVNAYKWNAEYEMAVAKNGKIEFKYRNDWLENNPAQWTDMYWLNNMLNSAHVGFNFGGFSTYSNANVNSNTNVNSNANVNVHPPTSRPRIRGFGN